MRLAFVCLLSLPLVGCGAPVGSDHPAARSSALAQRADDTAAPVHLIAAEAVSDTPNCGVGCPVFDFTSKLIARVHVANLAFQKHVFAAYHVRASNGAIVQDWTTVDANWVSDDDWELETPGYVGSCPHYCAELVFEFAIGYEVAGTTYWDNNDGWNYQVASDIGPVPGDVGPPALLGVDHVMLAESSWSGDDNTWRGRIVLDNLAYQKNVALVFSTDGWSTVQTAAARYQGQTSHGLEYWTFAVPMDPSLSAVDFGVRYQVAGQTYWDNHLGRNYRNDGPRLVFHETFDDQAALLHPRPGSDGTLVGKPTFVDGVQGKAYYVTTAESEALSYAGRDIPGQRGTLEFWARLFTPPATIPWHDSPYFVLAPVTDYDQYAVGLNGNDGWGGGGLVAWAGHNDSATGCFTNTYSYADVLGGADQVEAWHRYALIWDKDGLPGGTTDTIRLYLDGKPVGTSSFCGESHRSTIFPVAATQLFIGAIQDNFAGSAFAIDELRIWNYAKTE